jgi:murein DD-endopeptidase MepM/ murein hydrolase activator NlpD
VTSQLGGKHREQVIGTSKLLAGGLFLILFMALSGAWFGYQCAMDDAKNSGISSYQDLVEVFKIQRMELSDLEASAERHQDALGSRLGLLQSRLTRLEVLAGRLVDLGKLDASEFDFSQPTALGGVVEAISEAQSLGKSLVQDLDRLEAALRDQEVKLSLLESLLVNRRLQLEMTPSGKPVHGTISSGFGVRRDPFHGRQTFHKGLDFQARSGTQIVAVATGIVTFSGIRTGYGYVVEIQHANNLVTRYAHNRKNLVKEGDPVTKGQVIAELGNTGRSTGPHLHFEVVKDGVQVNPVTYLKGG